MLLNWRIKSRFLKRPDLLDTMESVQVLFFKKIIQFQPTENLEKGIYKNIIVLLITGGSGLWN
jgi:hypothetical protein